MTFVLVPGAWLGGWCWRDVASSLRAAGHDAIAVTLTGLGERAHLLTPDTGLQTHVSDLIAVLRFRDLHGVTLVSHSYGGMVITAAVEQEAERVKRLVYLDASVPQDGESNADVLGTEMARRIRESARHAGDGWRVPPPSIADWHLPASLSAWVEHRLTPHPLRSIEEPVHLQSRAAAAIERVFLRSSTQSLLYGRLMERSRRSGWHCQNLGGGHYPMLSAPDVVASALLELPMASGMDTEGDGSDARAG
jgi:pimeloyl-ACP methyl ester carboxylesterase